MLKPGRQAVALIVLSIFWSLKINGQAPDYDALIRVRFTDKGDYSASQYKLSDLLTDRAVKRRLKYGITAPDFSDLPVYKTYISTLEGEGMQLRATSKWLNSALFTLKSISDTANLKKYPFISSYKIAKITGSKGTVIDKGYPATEGDGTPTYDRALTMINGYALHNSGFDGKGVLIGILDAGFINGDIVSSLRGLRARGGIMATRDFVAGGKDVYDFSTHGTAILTVMAGRISNQIEGTGPGADFILIRTEDVYSEYPCEEDFWAAGAEYADSLGADIISSSLGYNQFDDSSLSYNTAQLDGKSAFVTLAAEMAASKGIVVVNSAGNERNKGWKKIMFPADGFNVLSVGAVDYQNNIAGFSSAGPSADKRVKPDICALGVNTTAQVTQEGITPMSGTSLSCPVISGMLACLLQAVPEAKNHDIIEALQLSADRHNSPDSLYGYGIPDMKLALNILQESSLIKPDASVLAAPNPGTGSFRLIFREAPGNFTLQLFNSSGAVICSRYYPEPAGRSVYINELEGKAGGIYLARITGENKTTTIKIIKTGR